MTVAEMRTLLATLPDHAQFCYCSGDERGTILEVSQIDVVRVFGSCDGYLAQDDGTNTCGRGLTARQLVNAGEIEDTPCAPTTFVWRDLGAELLIQVKRLRVEFDWRECRR
jgi:hypothetical protein